MASYPSVGRKPPPGSKKKKKKVVVPADGGEDDPWYRGEDGVPDHDLKKANGGKRPKQPTTPRRYGGTARGAGRLKMVAVRARRQTAQRGLLNWLSDQLQGQHDTDDHLQQCAQTRARAIATLPEPPARAAACPLQSGGR